VTQLETNPVVVMLLQILAVHGNILEDRFLGPVAVYLVREYRVLAYSQFLEAYKRYYVVGDACLSLDCTLYYPVAVNVAGLPAFGECSSRGSAKPLAPFFPAVLTVL
jgi:hypothetical protein